MSSGQQTGSLGTVFQPVPDLDPGGNRLLPPAQLRRLPRRRRPAMVLLAVVLIGVGVLGSAALYVRQNHQIPVLLVVRTVSAGQVITSADIATTSVAAGPGIKVIPARQLPQVIGLVAANTLQPGTLLANSELTTAAPPAAGQVLVPVAVHPSVLPAEGLGPGDQVLVVATPAASGSASTTGSAPILAKPVSAIVEQVSAAPNQDGLVVVDLLVPYGNGIAVAQQAATGQVALIVTHRSR